MLHKVCQVCQDVIIRQFGTCVARDCGVFAPRKYQAILPTKRRVNGSEERARRNARLFGLTGARKVTDLTGIDAGAGAVNAHGLTYEAWCKAANRGVNLANKFLIEAWAVSSNPELHRVNGVQTDQSAWPQDRVLYRVRAIFPPQKRRKERSARVATFAVLAASEADALAQVKAHVEANFAPALFGRVGEYTTAPCGGLLQLGAMELL